MSTFTNLHPTKLNTMDLSLEYFLRKGHPSFSAKNNSETSFRTIFYHKRAVIFEEGLSLNAAYLIESGFCKISKMSSNGKYQIIQILKPKTLLGMRSIINNEPTNLKAEALTDLKACLIPKVHLFYKLQNDIDFSNSIVKILAQYIKEADDKIVSLGNEKLEERLAAFLLYFHNEFHDFLKNSYSLSLKREEIANYIGVATESMIRMLKCFEIKGFISLEGREIKIKNRAALEQLAKGLT